MLVSHQVVGSDCCLSPQAYNIHVNGVLHCRVRYSQLLGLHEQVWSCEQLGLQTTGCTVWMWSTGALGVGWGGGVTAPTVSFGGSCSALLSSQLRKEYGANVVPAFPPKKIFTLTPAEVEQRREQLEKYMQAGKLSVSHAVAQGWLPQLGCSGLCPHLPPHTVAHLDALSLALVVAGFVNWISSPLSHCWQRWGPAGAFSCRESVPAFVHILPAGHV